MERTTLTMIFLLAAVLLAGCASFVTGSERSAAAQEASGPSFGYSLRLGYTRYLDEAILDYRLDTAKSAGATTVLVPVGWDQLEPADEAYSWAYLDHTVAEVEARGMKPSLQLQASPAWVRPSGSSVWYPPNTSAQRAYWRDMVKDVTARYGTRVARYELWNEPNLPTFWATGSPKSEWPKEYAALLRQGYLGAKEGNPNVTVVSAGISKNDVGYLKALYPALKAYPDAAANYNFFDELGLHPYAACGSTPQTPLAPSDYNSCAVWPHGPWGNVDDNFLGIDRMKQVMDDNGDAHKKAWLGEMGYSHVQTWMKAVPDATRAVWLKEAYSLASQRPWVAGLSWYTFQDDSEWEIVSDANVESQTFKAFREATKGAAAAPVAADTMIREAAQTTNYGSATSLDADGDDPGGTGEDSYALLRFDLSGLAGKTVKSAKLELDVTSATGGAYQVYRLKRAWVENQATWQLWKTSYYWQTYGAKGADDRSSTVQAEVRAAATGVVSVALPPALVQGWVDAPASNYGIILTNPSNTDGLEFSAKGSARPPVLKMTY